MIQIRCDARLASYILSRIEECGRTPSQEVILSYSRSGIDGAGSLQHERVRIPVFEGRTDYRFPYLYLADDAVLEGTGITYDEKNHEIKIKVKL